MSSRGRSNLLRVEEQRPVHRARQVALEGTASLAGSLSFGTFARQEQLRSVVSSGLGKRHCVQRSVQLAVPAAVQPVPDDRVARGWDRSGAGVRGEGRRRGERPTSRTSPRIFAATSGPTPQIESRFAGAA